MMTGAKVQGLAMAVIDDGKVVFVRSWGRRNVEKNLPLQIDTIMYGASLTKFAFAYMVMQLVDEGTIDLDRSIAAYLPKPLPEYPFYEALKGDERWRKLTPRILLSHTSGLANFAFLEPDEKMRFHFDPGSRYAYSGEGIILLQFVLETGLGSQGRRRDAASGVRSLRDDADQHDVAGGLRRKPRRRIRHRRWRSSRTTSEPARARRDRWTRPSPTSRSSSPASRAATGCRPGRARR